MHHVEIINNFVIVIPLTLETVGSNKGNPCENCGPVSMLDASGCGCKPNGGGEIAHGKPIISAFYFNIV